MKFVHLSDLHLGKRVNGFSMMEDQEYILAEILKVIDTEQPDGVLIAGDLYDRPVPPAEAVRLWDDFLWQLSERKLQVFVISGNHDSAERVAFGNRLMNKSGVHLAPVYDGQVAPVTLQDEWGPVHVFMLPFVKPALVRACFPEEEIHSYTDAVQAAVTHMELQPGERKLLVTHQFVTGAERSDSEEVSIGGTDNVDAAVFDGFDYVALGHIHRPQNMKEGRIRYCGTPLKYSFSEAGHEKSVTVVELGASPVDSEAGYAAVQVRAVPLRPKRDLVELRGSYEEVTLKSFYENTSWQEDYVHIILTDEEDIPEGAARLRTIYHNLMKLSYDNRRTQGGFSVIEAPDEREQSPVELFGDFYEKQNNQKMSEAQQAFVETLMKQVWEDEP